MTTTSDPRRLSAQSRVRLAAVEDLRARHRLLTQQSLRRLEAGRLLLGRPPPAAEV